MTRQSASSTRKTGKKATQAAFSPQTAQSLLRSMYRIRHFEETVARLKRQDEVYSLIHLSMGQEAVAAAVCSQLRDTDAVYSGHRAHGHAIAKGAPLGAAMAELMGRVDGLCQGMGGSMHLVDVEHGFLGATGVVGGNLPMALGSALAKKLSSTDDVAVIFFGDGAVQAGVFNETINLAALWRLPIIFVCENNGFAEFTPRSAHTPVERVTDVVAPYGMERETVDGNDLAAIHRIFGGYLEGARSGSGPYLLECLTHRLRGHYEGDADKYRETVGQVELQEIDPILRVRREGLAEGWFTEADIALIESETADEIAEAVTFARASEYPTWEQATALVFAEDQS